MTTSIAHLSNWIVDYSASHHITSDLHNLFIYANYRGNEEIIIGDGDGILITHSSFIVLNLHANNFTLNILYAPHIKKNLIFFLNSTNKIKSLFNFFPDSFLVKDLSKGVSLV